MVQKNPAKFLQADTILQYVHIDKNRAKQTINYESFTRKQDSGCEFAISG